MTYKLFKHILTAIQSKLLVFVGVVHTLNVSMRERLCLVGKSPDHLGGVSDFLWQEVLPRDPIYASLFAMVEVEGNNSFSLFLVGLATAPFLDVDLWSPSTTFAHNLQKKPCFFYEKGY